MQERADNLQLELFSQSQDSGEVNNRAPNNLFLARIWKYEKTILIIIGIIITGIASFSLGVEKGKTLSGPKNSLSTVTQNEQNRKIIIKKEEPKNQPMATPAATMMGKQYYAIQVASFKTKTLAQKEVELLKTKGFSPSLITKGNYTILCVGNFSNKETAQPSLLELKKRYRDCYIRRL